MKREIAPGRPAAILSRQAPNLSARALGLFDAGRVSGDLPSRLCGVGGYSTAALDLRRVHCNGGISTDERRIYHPPTRDHGVRRHG